MKAHEESDISRAKRVLRAWRDYQMTPFELAIENDLKNEADRFSNQWLFRWHGLTYENGKTDVEDFRGGRISYGGSSVFGDQKQQIYWQAIDRYLLLKVHEIFQRWEGETKSYPIKVRLASIDGVERALGRFVTTVKQSALNTAQRLRNSSGALPAGHHVGVPPGAEVQRLAQAHRVLLEAEVAKDAERGRKPLQLWKWLETAYANNPALIWLVRGIIGLCVGAAGYLLGLFHWIFG